MITQTMCVISLKDIVYKYKMKKMYFKWFQLIQAIPKSRKKDRKNDLGDCRNIVYLNNHLIKENQIDFIEKLKANELYFLSMSLRKTVPTLQKYFDFFFQIDPVGRKMFLSLLVV